MRDHQRSRGRRRTQVSITQFTQKNGELIRRTMTSGGLSRPEEASILPCSKSRAIRTRFSQPWRLVLRLNSGKVSVSLQSEAPWLGKKRIRGYRQFAQPYHSGPLAHSNHRRDQPGQFGRALVQLSGASGWSEQYESGQHRCRRPGLFHSCP